MKRFIINADDYGMSESINEAIEVLSELGSISSISIMTNMPFVENISKLLKRVPQIGIGVHLTLSQGRPLSHINKVSTLVNSEGEFYSNKQLLRKMLKGCISFKECILELEEQLKRVTELIGCKLDHWNTHQGIHRVEPFYSIFAKTCNKFNIPSMRIHKHYWIQPRGSQLILNEHRLDGGIKSKLIETYYRWLKWRAKSYYSIPEGIIVLNDLSQLDCLEQLSKPTQGVYEIVCHPATSMSDLSNTTMRDSRVREFHALTNPTIIEWIGKYRTAGFITTFKDLQKIETSS